VHDVVGDVLDERRGRSAGGRALWLSLVLHAAAAAGFLVAPLLRAEAREPLQFTGPVMIVPAATLGVRQPEPPAPPTPAEPEPQPEPERPPEPEPRPTVPAQERAPTPPPQERPHPSRPTSELQRRQGSPTGSSTGTATFGASGVGIEDPNFRYTYYVDQLAAMISSFWTRPPIGGEIQAVVAFRIRRDGAISDPRIVQSSGFSSFDLAALRAVQQAAPFPRLPQTYKEESVGVNVIFH
jgi:protein TonB